MNLTFRALTSVLLITLLLGNVSAAAPNSSASQSDACVVYFYSPSCPHCAELDQHLEENNYDVQIKKYRASENSELFQSYVKHYNMSDGLAGSIPAVFSGDRYAVGTQNAIDLIQRSENESLSCVEPDQSSGEEITVAGIAGLAAADAVNPCAIAVLLVLITSILSREKGNKKMALKTGLAFVSAIMMTYLAMGVLILLGFRSATSLTSLEMSGITRWVGALAVTVGLLNLKDYFSHGSLGFAMEVPFSWRPKMKEFIRSVTSPVGAFGTGVIVSLFLLPCTSGPYFVAGGILAETGVISALPWLILYNAVFVAPMVAILLAVYTGYTTVEEMMDWREENIEYLHLVAGGLLIAVGLAMILGIL